ncbi:MAG: FeoB-associated Cys-rich membrane protein [Butyrivibrio crossotus]|nr:FeoB-associated Cys-rich membrane protein [Butyrivibrio crossotus]
MENAIVIAILFIVVGGAGYYIFKKKKNGAKCIGCPCAKTCSKKHPPGH